MKVAIMRGLPGSGKSHLAKAMVDAAMGSAAVFSADDFFLDNEGIYRFDPTKLSEAHADCFSRFLWAVNPESDFGEERIQLVVVDNTNIQAWEISPYILAANAFGYEHEVINVRCDNRIAFARQTHGVPFEVHGFMDERLANEKLPPFWNVRDYHAED